MTSPVTRSGHTIIDSGSSGVPGMFTTRGSKWASLASTASPLRIAQPVMPASSGLSWLRISSANRSRETTARRTQAARSTR